MIKPAQFIKEKEEKLLQVRGFSAGNMLDLPYHNFLHAIDVRNACRRLVKSEYLSYQDEFLLETAAYLHDIIYEINSKNNEERSSEVAQKLLIKIDYSLEEITKVKSLILATKIPTNPKTKLEEVICDADVDNIGREDFFEKCELLRQEQGVDDRQLWYKNVLKFLENHKYYTQSARELRQNGLERNKKGLKALIEKL